MPGEEVPALGWPGTKNGHSHRVWLPRAAREIIGSGSGDTGSVFARVELDAVMRDICKKLGVRDKVTPHDLRRTHGSTITGLGFGRDAMNRIQNHREGGIADVYDRHKYEAENKRVMETVVQHILKLAQGRPEGVVISGVF
jgi:integrase